MQNYVLFTSKNGTEYRWERPVGSLFDLTAQEILLTRVKIRALDDADIQNQQHNGKPMGLPIALSRPRMVDLYNVLRTVVNRKNHEITLTSHAIDRLMEDWALPQGDPNKRGWDNEDDVRNCVRKAVAVTDPRLNIDHHDRRNTATVKYIKPFLSFTVHGPKVSGNGKVVSVIIGKKAIQVNTIL